MSDGEQEWEDFLSIENMRQSWRRVRNSNRLEVKDRLGLSIFAFNIDLHLENLSKDLRNEAYSPEPLQRLYFPKRSGTLRPFPFLSMRDRLVYQAIGNVVIKKSYGDLLAYADRTIFANLPQSPDSDFTLLSAKSIGDKKGQYEKFKEAILTLRQDPGNGWIVKTDIAGFYPSIEHGLLKQTLEKRKWLTHKALLNLLDKCLEAWGSYEPGFPIQRGVPVGYETSDILSTLYLLDVDEKMLSVCKLIRYVDDMYLFTSDRARARNALIQLDRFLQEKALILQASKTDFEQLSNSESDDEYKVEAELRDKLSLISLDLKGPDEDVKTAQESLVSLFWKTWKQGISSETITENYDEFRETYLKNDATLAFILYRLQIKSPQIRDIALYLLDNLPWRSVNITKYLSLFEDDSVVIARLMELANDDFSYDAVRVDCLEALTVICSDVNTIRSIARSWYTDPSSWHLKLIALTVLGSYQDEMPLLRSASKKDSSPQNRALAISKCFELTNNALEKRALIDQALRDPNDYVQAVGIYLLRREVTLIDPKKIKGLSEFGKVLLTAPLQEDTEDIPAYVRELFYWLFGFEINPQLALGSLFSDITELRQLLLDVRDSKDTDPDICANALIQIGRRLTNAIFAVDELFPDTILGEANKSISGNIGFLRGTEVAIAEKAKGLKVLSGINKPIVLTRQIQPILEALSIVFASMFEIAHDQQSLLVPRSLQYKASLIYSELKNKQYVFISHANEDTEPAILVRNAVEKVTKTWMDKFDINSGFWDRQIFKEGLPQSWAMIVVASPEAMNSDNVLDEVDYARRYGMLILVLRLKECELERLSRVQYVDATKDTLENAIESLAQQLRDAKEKISATE